MKKPTRKEIDKSLKYSVIEGSFNSVKNSVLENFIVPFALMLGAGNEMIGFITSLPQLFGMLLQTLSTKIINMMNSKKRTTILFKLIGNLFWIPIILIPFVFENGVLWLLLFLCIRQAIISIDNTAWSSWVSDIVPKKIRGSFFGKRNMFGNAVGFVTSLLAGWFLGVVSDIYGFILLFIAAFISNLVSNYLLGKMVELPLKKHPKIKFSFRHFIRGIKNHSNYSNFVLFRSLMNFAIHISAPFWIVYVLQNLNIGYFWYGVSIGVYMIVNIISQKYWGRLADKFGDKKIMFVCSFLLPIAALMMVFITDIWQLMIERIFWGFALAGYSITTFNYLLNSSPSDDSATFIANYKVFNGIGTAAGPILGGFLAVMFADQLILGLGALQFLFLIAFFLRLIIASTMITRLHSIRVKKHIAFRNVFLKTTLIYPVESVKHEFSYIIHSINRWEHKFKSKIGYK